MELWPCKTHAEVPNLDLREPSLTATAVPFAMAAAMVVPSSSFAQRSKAHLIEDGRVSSAVERVVGTAGGGLSVVVPVEVRRISVPCREV